MTTQASDTHGVSALPASFQAPFEIPTESGVGSTRDMGSLVLFLVANWFVNGETVLIDGGVRLIFSLLHLNSELKTRTLTDSPEASLSVLSGIDALLLPSLHALNFNSYPSHWDQ